LITARQVEPIDTNSLKGEQYVLAAIGIERSSSGFASSPLVRSAPGVS
jgi:hypothetical protein